ncbi:MAG: TetR/AcrR family transcriptional regulator [Furfurilactobacillus sp.]|jgi:AcrR family transcriptional regulator|uniref:TetR/AcrR family transcriptional regulator n=2 Tax=Furfurilactobacillus TaxID=2767882 RepID=A0ABT6DF15_9LACO|nr:MULTISPECIES: TetR/AcrR family transcriptional regulator [Furfurilactobacillus]QLE65445.1 Transcriptional regulator [Furfurilactobacillus rossiae]MCF6160943.1 TetR/AcrR family transcriptional regulator [Furfurilactobacillus milii]MCF6163291.1 TetR/AcrR family transcriptional regulator [Furfurilactobacillus milii]MCH4011952.1 TetR/AcrR family transcriptional regulator [Furfurilactobacillus sp.]MCH4037844.1 TetR/AcrR family transcriptional regulator [Furfurilactobacillus sp.]
MTTQDTKEKNTEVALKKAFVKLVTAKTFRKMTIRDIATTAHISRGTFYLHYVDKYAMLAAYEDELIAGIEQIFADYTKVALKKSDQVTDNVFYHMFVYLNRHKRLVQTLYRIPESSVMSKMTAFITAEVARETITGESDQHGEGIPLEYARAILVQNISGIITQWFQKAQPESPREIFDIFMNSRVLSPIDLTALVQNEK